MMRRLLCSPLQNKRTFSAKAPKSKTAFFPKPSSTKSPFGKLFRRQRIEEYTIPGTSFVFANKPAPERCFIQPLLAADDYFEMSFSNKIIARVTQVLNMLLARPAVDAVLSEVYLDYEKSVNEGALGSLVIFYEALNEAIRNRAHLSDELTLDTKLFSKIGALLKKDIPHEEASTFKFNASSLISKKLFDIYEQSIDEVNSDNQIVAVDVQKFHRAEWSDIRFLLRVKPPARAGNIIGTQKATFLHNEITFSDSKDEDIVRLEIDVRITLDINVQNGDKGCVAVFKDRPVVVTLISTPIKILNGDVPNGAADGIEWTLKDIDYIVASSDVWRKKLRYLEEQQASDSENM